MGNLFSSSKSSSLLENNQRESKGRASFWSKSDLSSSSLLLILHLITLPPYWPGLIIAAAHINEHISSVNGNMCSFLFSVRLTDDFQETIQLNTL